MTFAIQFDDGQTAAAASPWSNGGTAVWGGKVYRAGGGVVRGTGLVTGFAGWWRQPDRYDWVVQLVESSGYGRFTRLGIAGACAAIGAWPILMTFSPQGVSGSTSRIVTVLCGVIALFFACWWLVGWPTYRQSKVVVVILNVSITVNCVVYVIEDKPVTGTLAFALTASYVACVHSFPHLSVVLGLAAVPIVMRMVIVGMSGDIADGLADGMLRLASVIVVPMTIRTLVQLLGDTAVVSDIDPLTELANRRGLVRAVRQLVAGAVSDGRTSVCLTMIDIDDFKTINDTRGHASGDHVLVALGQMLRRICPKESVIARIGGEEFAIVALGGTAEAVRIAERLRVEFDTAQADFTASYGIATAALRPKVPVDTIALTERLLGVADDAMYIAKRAGGNRIEVAARLER
jgi:diguanylate cyclase (GGDEF)-like protein